MGIEAFGVGVINVDTVGKNTNAFFYVKMKKK